MLNYLLMVLLLDSTMVSNGWYPVKCKGVSFHNKFYDKEKLFGSLARPSNLVYHKLTDNLFFSYSNWGSDTPGPKIRVCNIATRTCHDVKKVENGRTIGYQRMNNKIYLGGDGLHTYNFITNSTLLYSKVSGIMRIFIYKKIYLIRSKKLFTFINRQLKRVTESKGMEIDNFFISKNLSVYLSNKTGLYKADKSKDPVYLLSKTVNVSQIDEDFRTGNVFFATSDGIYVDDLLQHKFKKVANINETFGITFRNRGRNNYRGNQIIYSDYNSIYMLTISNNSKLCLNNKKQQIINSYLSKFYATNPSNYVAMS